MAGCLLIIQYKWDIAICPGICVDISNALLQLLLLVKYHTERLIQKGYRIQLCHGAQNDNEGQTSKNLRTARANNMAIMVKA